MSLKNPLTVAADHEFASCTRGVWVASVLGVVEQDLGTVGVQTLARERVLDAKLLVNLRECRSNSLQRHASPPDRC
jgi:hypothetical protein